MLQSFNRSQPGLPPVIQSYIHGRIARRAACFELQAEDQIQNSKSMRLREIELRYQYDMIKKAVRGRP